MDETTAAIRRAGAATPTIDRAAAGVASFKGETAQVRDKIDPSGDVVDHASPELRTIRDRLRKEAADQGVSLALPPPGRRVDLDPDRAAEPAPELPLEPWWEPSV